MTIRSRILKVGATKSLEMVLITLIRFFSVPLYLYAWDTNLYGEWLILFAFLGYFTLGNLGFAQAAANDMTMLVARNERESALKTYQNTFFITIILSMILLLLTLVLVVILLPRLSFLQFPILDRDNSAGWILILFSVYIIGSFFINLITAGYRCEGLFHRALLYSSISFFIEFVATALFLLAKSPPITIAVVMVVVRTFAILAMWIDLSRLKPWVKFGFSQIDRATMRSLVSPSISFAAFPLGQTIVNQGIILSLGAFSTPASVVLFSTFRTLTNMATRVFVLVDQAFYPELSMAFASNQIDLFKKLHRVAYQICIWAGLATVALLFFAGEPIYSIWVNNKVEFNSNLFNLLLISLIFRSFWHASFTVPASINGHKKITFRYLILSFIGLSISWLLLRLQIDISLSAIGIVAIEIAMIFVVLPEAMRLTDDGFKSLFKQALLPPTPKKIFAAITRGKME